MQGGQITSKAGLEFLITEAETGLTFAKIALSARDNPEKFERNLGNAKIAYDTIQRFRNRIEMTPLDAGRLDAAVELVRAALIELGEPV